MHIRRQDELLAKKKKKINLKKINTNGNDIQTCETENISNELRGKCLKQ